MTTKESGMRRQPDDSSDIAASDKKPVRPAEYWEIGYELLDDLALHLDDVEAARWIIVRYAAIRAVAGLLADTPNEREVRIERNVGLNHLRAVPMLDREARSLLKMLNALNDTSPNETLMLHLVNAGMAAATRGHTRGAYAMFNLAYRMSVPRRWFGDAARAARGIETLARDGGAVYSPRLWRRRARVMEKRAAAASA